MTECTGFTLRPVAGAIYLPQHAHLTHVCSQDCCRRATSCMGWRSASSSARSTSATTPSRSTHRNRERALAHLLTDGFMLFEHRDICHELLGHAPLFADQVCLGRAASDLWLTLCLNAGVRGLFARDRPGFDRRDGRADHQARAREHCGTHYIPSSGECLQLQCYWFSVEFGLCQQNNERKAYGAGA